MSNLPVKEIVLYKHGVGFFQREGKIKGEEAVLTFREDEINDVLKSLAAFDKAGGQILSIHYRTPMDKAQRLANSSIRLSSDASLLDLLKSLRGRDVQLELSEHQIAGRLIGVDVEDEEQVNRSLVSLVDKNEGVVRVLPLHAVRGVRILDEQAKHDLHYFLDTSTREDLRREVTLRLNPGEHTLVVYYVAPSPTWRVSYRMVAELEKGKQEGSALIQGWGLFDNRLDEDLQDVKVTLVAGQPISFIYDLYASRIPDRPVVQDEARVAPRPVEFKAGRMHDVSPKRLRRMEKAGGMMMAEAESADMAMAAPAPLADAPVQAYGMEEARQATRSAAEGEEAGEFFRYVVKTPVTVKRGGSALVPIVGADLSYSKELLYNATKLPQHPVAAIRFKNTTDLTLERGPVTVIEDGEYVGEAIVPFTKTDNEVYLPYAVELGVQVTERHDSRAEMAGLDLRDRYLIINEYQVQTTTYIIENTTDRDLTVTVEAPVRSGFELFDTAEPDVKTANERRWRLDVLAHNTIEFERAERRMTRRHEEIRRLDYHRLQRFMDGRWLDRSTFDLLAGLLDNIAFIEQAKEEQTELENERRTIYERQEQLRKNLSALRAERDEGSLRARMLQQLEATEDRIDMIESRLNDLTQQIAEAETQIEQTMLMLSSEG